MAAYTGGRHREAEAAAQQVVATAAPPIEKARARWVLAFSAARRNDFRTARERFTQLRKEAAGTGWTLGGGQETVPDGPRTEPTLEEEAAYQHAVLSLAIAQRKGQSAKGQAPEERDAGIDTEASASAAAAPPPTVAAAEREFVAFLRRYPESPLIHAAVRRIARLHGGDVPKEAEAAWKAAMALQAERQREREVRLASCGPEVLREVLRRSSGVDGETEGQRDGETLASLAAELGTE